MKNIRAIVVDDTALFRKIVSDALSGVEGIEVVATAPNGRTALAKIEQLKPDMITLDIEMPDMSGIEVLEELAKRKISLGVVIVSALTLKGGALTIKALQKGAFDFVTKPTGGSVEENRTALKDSLKPVLKAWERKQGPQTVGYTREKDGKVTSCKSQCSVGQSMGTSASPNNVVKKLPAKIDRVLIGISTGGPNALSLVIPALPGNLRVPVFIVQHMPPVFTAALAQSLNDKSEIDVCEAQHNIVARPQTAYIAPGGKQMRLVKGPGGEEVIKITDDPPENNCKPSVDYLFRSVAMNFPGTSLSAILTGMGNDGMVGVKLLKRTGCYSIAQDKETSVVYGMPRAVVEAGVADEILSLDMIPKIIVNQVERRIR